MDERRIVTIEEVEAMSPAEQERSFEEALVYDLTTLPPAVLADIRQFGRVARARREAQRRPKT